METCKSAVLLAPPTPLHTKTAPAIFFAGRSRARTPRERGHRALCINHYCFDRAQFAPLAKLFMQEVEANAKLVDAGETNRDYLWLQEWNVATGCAIHDAHNSLKWGLHTHLLGPLVFKKVWKVFASIRNSYNPILKHMAAWLLSSVVWTRDEDLPAVEKMQSMWTALGIPPKLKEVLSEDLRLHWDATTGPLHISNRWEGNPKSIEEMSAAVFGL